MELNEHHKNKKENTEEDTCRAGNHFQLYPEASNEKFLDWGGTCLIKTYEIDKWV